MDPESTHLIANEIARLVNRIREARSELISVDFKKGVKSEIDIDGKVVQHGTDITTLTITYRDLRDKDI